LRRLAVIESTDQTPGPFNEMELEIEQVQQILTYLAETAVRLTWTPINACAAAEKARLERLLLSVGESSSGRNDLVPGGM